ncbi:MAG TPA: hypothetical protein VJ812_01645 [Gemmatimonadaceae bacterium]|jgi:hypothetical protein|nr:hypothetical protein [Gemmatimonadaceae bacterium]
MRTLLRILLLSLAFVVGTALIGWWTVPLLAALWGIIAHGVPRAGVLAGFAAMLGWAILLALAARAPAFEALATSIAGVVRVPPASLIAITLIFPALLAWSAARLTAVATTLVRGSGAAASDQGAAEATGADAGDTSSAGERPREVYASK